MVNDLNIFLQDRLEHLKGNLTEFSNHLVQVFGAYYDEGSIRIVMELMDAGSLRGLLNMAKELTPAAPYIEEPYLANIAYQVTIDCELVLIFGFRCCLGCFSSTPRRSRSTEI